MRASFSLDGCYELEISGNVPRTQRDPESVCLNLLHTPLPVPMPGPDGTGYVQPPTETTFSISLRPSHARAIASALLSAATEARA